MPQSTNDDSTLDEFENEAENESRLAQEVREVVEDDGARLNDVRRNCQGFDAIEEDGY